MRQNCLSCRAAIVDTTGIYTPRKIVTVLPLSRPYSKTFCRAVSICRKIRNAAELSAVPCRLVDTIGLYTPPKLFPFCGIYRHTAKSSAAPCRYTAKLAMSQNCLPCRVDFPIHLAYILIKNCCRFAALPYLRPDGKTFSRAVPICQKIDKVAELSTVPFRLADTMGLYGLQKIVTIKPFYRIYGLTVKPLPHRADMLLNRQCGRTVYRAVETLPMPCLIFSAKNCRRFAFLHYLRPHGKTFGRAVRADMLHKR